MALIDPRDPRSPGRQTKSVQESLSDISDGLLTLMTRQDAIMSEMMATTKDISRSMAVGERIGGDRMRAGAGSAGLRRAGSPMMDNFTPALVGDGGDVPVAPERSDVQLQGHVPSKPGRQSLTDYTLDPTRPLGAQTRQGIRAGVFSALTSRAETVQGQLATTVGAGSFSDADGNRYEMDPDVGMVRMTGIGEYIDQNGNPLDAATAGARMTMSAQQVARSERKLTGLSTAARAAQAWSTGNASLGRSVIAALPGGLIKGAGVAGAAYAIGNQALDFAQSQYAEQQKMREIYGDISNAEALGERASSWYGRNVTGRLSWMGAGNWSALEGSGRQNGLRGDALGNYIDTGSDIMSTGANRGQTTAIMDAAIGAGNGLAGLADAIRQVNDAAREAGTNAARARDIFIKNYEASSEIMFGATGATQSQFAASITAAQTNQGREFQNVNSLMGTMANSNWSRAIAGSTGMSPTEFALARQESPGAAAALTEDFQIKMLDTAPSNKAGARPIRQVVSDWIQRNGGYDPRYNQDDLGEALLAEGYDPVMLQQYLSQMGINATEGQAPGIVANMYSPASAGRTAVRDEAEAATALAPGVVGDKIMGMDASQIVGQYNVNNSLIKEYAAGINGGKTIRDGDSFNNLEGKATSPVIESLIGNADALGLDKDDTKVRVKVGNGYRVVSLGDALRYFPDQMQAGTANFVDGVSDTIMDSSVARAVGMPESMVSEAQGTWMDRASGGARNANRGEDFESWDANRRADQRGANGGGGTVMFELTPEAQRLLRPVDDQYYATTAPEWDGHSPTGGG